MSEIITNNFFETQKIGEEYAAQIKNGGILCLEGELGAGKTTFTQGLLQGLGCAGPFTSPTFLVIKHYKKEISNSKFQIPNKFQNPNIKFQNIYHVDAYRISEDDLDNLGWEELISEPKNIIIIEWPERIKKKIPSGAKWIKFEWIDQNKRKVIF